MGDRGGFSAQAKEVINRLIAFFAGFIEWLRDDIAALFKSLQFRRAASSIASFFKGFFIGLPNMLKKFFSAIATFAVWIYEDITAFVRSLPTGDSVREIGSWIKGLGKFIARVSRDLYLDIVHFLKWLWRTIAEVTTSPGTKSGLRNIGAFFAVLFLSVVSFFDQLWWLIVDFFKSDEFKSAMKAVGKLLVALGIDIASAAVWLWQLIVVAAKWLWKWIVVASKWLWKWTVIGAVWLWGVLSRFFVSLARVISEFMKSPRTREFIGRCGEGLSIFVASARKIIGKPEVIRPIYWIIIFILGGSFLRWVLFVYPESMALRFVGSDGSMIVERAIELENSTRTVNALIVCGFAVVVLFIWGITAFIKSSIRRLEIAEKSVRLNERRNIAGMLAGAIEQLGGDKLEARIAAVYMLEQIATGSKEDCGAVSAVLSTFIRKSPVRSLERGEECPADEYFKWARGVEDKQAGDSAGISAVESMEAPGPDIQVALDVIRRMKP
ncbi:hypothetical protein J7K50_07550 [bacterium]|nr:hypothetical protein [bacterium]